MGTVKARIQAKVVALGRITPRCRCGDSDGVECDAVVLQRGDVKFLLPLKAAAVADVARLGVLGSVVVVNVEFDSVDPWADALAGRENGAAAPAPDAATTGPIIEEAAPRPVAPSGWCDECDWAASQRCSRCRGAGVR